jgi:hypothetical protein
MQETSEFGEGAKKRSREWNSAAIREWQRDWPHDAAYIVKHLSSVRVHVLKEKFQGQKNIQVKVGQHKL